MVEVRGHKDVQVDVPLIRHMILNTIRSYKVKHSAKFGSPVICCDGRKYWRKQVFPHYKAGRKKARDESGLNWDDLFQALNTVKEELKEFFPYPVVDVEGAEADDVIGALVEWTQTNNLTVTPGSLFDDGEPEPTLIVSGDHDFQQLHRFPNVKQYSPIQKSWVKVKGSPKHFLMEHIIRGDKGDGVPNILSPDDTFVSGGRQRPLKNDLVEKWKTLTRDDFCTTEEMKRNFDRNARLIDLGNIPQDIRAAIIHSYTSQRGARDRSKLLSYFIQKRMKNMIDCLTEF